MVGKDIRMSRQAAETQMWEAIAEVAVRRGLLVSAQAIETRRAATLGAVHESAVAESDAPERPSND